jgi:ornithine carbamoyltransferase
MRHFRTISDVSPSEFRDILEIARRLKQEYLAGNRPKLLEQRSLALLFEKPSLRTRLSFEAGMIQLGGVPIYMGQDVGWRTRENIADFVRVLGEYCDFLVCRTFAHANIDELASYDSLVIINGLSDTEHPCQAMADIMTMLELEPNLAGKQLTFIGDGNNVVRSLMQATATMGMKFKLLGPSQYHLSNSWIESIRKIYPAMDFEQSTDITSALAEADFVYTDVWTSMGQETEAAKRREVFRPYQISSRLMGHAPKHCRVLHCLPARRGEEITDEVIDSESSFVIPQAGNRMHLQKGLLVWLAMKRGWLDAKTIASI